MSRLFRYRRSKVEQCGALLVEALVSFAILLLASVVFYGLMATTRNAEAKAHQVMAANALARQTMESYRLKSYSSLKVGSLTSNHEVKGHRGGAEGITRLTNTATVYDGPGIGVKSIVVEVSWHQGRVQLESYVTE